MKVYETGRAANHGGYHAADSGTRDLDMERSTSIRPMAVPQPSILMMLRA